MLLSRKLMAKTIFGRNLFALVAQSGRVLASYLRGPMFKFQLEFGVNCFLFIGFQAMLLLNPSGIRFNAVKVPLNVLCTVILSVELLFWLVLVCK